jgi:DNA-nicking Smr family endonuclease
MNKLDLHGVKHSDVPALLDNFIYNNNGITDFQIITGNSEEMKKLVCSLLDTYAYDYQVGGFLKMNTGYIQVIG